jgi:hypothetical protein
MADDRTPEHPLTPLEPGEPIEAGGIYIRWHERLWQEQPDGSYLVWNEEAHLWEISSDQPPPPAGRTITTIECPNCGRRVRSTLRSCPYCEHALPQPERKAPVRPAARVEAKKKAKSLRQVPPVALLIAVLLMGGVVFGLIQARRARDCQSWKAAVQAYTKTTIDLNGLPQGMTEEEFHGLNESRFADRRPGGCE